MRSAPTWLSNVRQDGIHLQGGNTDVDMLTNSIANSFTGVAIASGINLPFFRDLL
ncbi:hypothetical protein [Microcoleus sp. herbarium14]|uniref:hypothetical protein n=1 Tax=Microcoleus sp. herbarium14 TaxID=3055439 RepID=UPI002FD6A04F